MRACWLGGIAAFAFVGCSTPKAADPPLEAPSLRSMTPTSIDYVDTDGFDVLLENALVNQDPVVIVRTHFGQPEWGDRLNAWIAAWNMAGARPSGERVRMQAPFVPQVVVDGDSIREFRLLIESLWTRIDEKSRLGLMWLSEEKVRSRRLRLLKPYNLRFHMNDDSEIDLVFFHGRYAEQYREFVARHTGRDGDEWERSCTASMCASSKRKVPVQLTSDETKSR